MKPEYLLHCIDFAFGGALVGIFFPFELALVIHSGLFLMGRWLSFSPILTKGTWFWNLPFGG